MERSIESAVDMFLLTENSAHKDALNQFFIRGYEGLLYTRSTNREGRIASMAPYCNNTCGERIIQFSGANICNSFTIEIKF